MIKLSNLEKYFNKNRQNEIHVINDINLELPKRGLVVLLGPSGSGKTTLLNVIGGLDRVHSGVIDFDGDEISGYNSNKWDRIRNDHIGYVFQNYNLLQEETVYDNIALSLRMAGIKDKEEIDKRINYILENVGMINFRRRRASHLSGGQQQRVAIARALAKNPKVIIADEPTGNLDSKNTYDIMNILRTISQNKLVVLVTHEESIANMYADRIIRLKDGQIVEDQSNQSDGGINVQLETDIYLKDMNQLTEHFDQASSFQVYSDEKTDANFNVRLIVKNKTLYVEVDSDKYNRINLLKNDSEIAIYDEHFKGQEIEEFTETDFNLENIIDDSKKEENRSVVSNKEAFRLAFSKFKKISKGSALIYVMFFFLAATIGVFLGLVFNAYHIEDYQFLRNPKDTVEVVFEDKDFDAAISHEAHGSIGYLQLLDEASGSIKLPNVYQASGRELTFSQFPVYARYMDESTIKYGNPITDQNQIIMSEKYAQELLRSTLAQSLGLREVDDLIDLEIVYNINDSSGLIPVEAIIVGIADIDDKAFYAKEETVWQMATGIPLLEMYEDSITFDHTDTENYEHPLYIKGDETATDLLGTDATINKFFDQTIQAIYSTTEENIPDSLQTLSDVKERQWGLNTDNLQQTAKATYFAVSPETAKEYLATVGSNADYPYPVERQEYLQNKLLQSVPYLLFAGLFLTVSSVSTYFILRSSLLSRIYEVSVYRALGAMKRDLRKIFLIEALILTFMTSLWGYLLTNFLLVRLQNSTTEYLEVIRVTPVSFVVGIIIIFAINIFSGIMPISNLLRKTPAEIISKYDF